MEGFLVRILWSSNAHWAPSGYGNQTNLFVPRLAKLGHEMAIHAFYGLNGSVLEGQGIRIYPGSPLHPHGQDNLVGHAQHFGADVVLTLYDAWVVETEITANHGILHALWFPVDHDPIPPPVLRKVRHCWQPIVYSRDAERQCLTAGIQPLYVPHGVDTAAYSPGDRAEARASMGIDPDTFLVGMVAANKGNPSRKAFPEAFAAFAALRRQHPDALLYCHTHTAERGEFGGVNLPELAAHHGIADSIVWPDQYLYHSGQIGHDYMAMAYRAMDVLLSPSLGEGFGIPILEAQACGTPVIVGDWTAMAELCFAGWKLPRERAHRWWSPLASYQFEPNEADIVAALEDAYERRGDALLALNAREGAMAYDADLVTERYWKPALAHMERRAERHKRVLRGEAA